MSRQLEPQFAPEPAAVLTEEQVQVRLGAALEACKQVVPADELYDRQVDRVVPVNDGLLETDIALFIEAHEVTVHIDVFQQLAVPACGGDAEFRAGPELVDAGLLQELRLLGLDDEPFGTDVRAQMHPRVQRDRKGTRLNSSHVAISYAVF